MDAARKLEIEGLSLVHKLVEVFRRNFINNTLNEIVTEPASGSPTACCQTGKTLEVEFGGKKKEFII